ncbi:nuclear transport factor 2 family protein [Leifsonia poae]|uniref:nuclear transport factor 2 family protein n=1 Tax=Leifsonia poae TaxID=110933 RepID=UPI003D69F902
MSTEDIVVAATERLFNRRDLSAVDDLFGPVYVQHSALAPDGVDGLRGLVSQLTEANGYELRRVLADGDLAVTEGVFTGFAPVPLVGYDVWRVSEGRIVEHWDALGPGAVPAPSASSAVAADTDREANRALVTSWVRDALIDGGDASDAIAPDVERFEDVTYSALHTVIAAGDLVYTRSEGAADVPVIVNDVWRVADGRIVEHWGLVAPVPANLPHGNGSF